MNFEHYYAVIMAGGGGTRLWPLSRQSRPKQMVRLGGERTLFQLAVDRLDGFFPPEHILIVTVAEQAVILQQQCPEIPAENYLIEPMPRGTASVVGLATVAVRQRDPQASVAILGADHLMQNVPYLHQLLSHAYILAQDGLLVTLGIRPTYPATGYGYIQRGAELEAYPFPAYAVRAFREKPDEATALKFLERGDHDWNSGMFIWRVDRISEEIERWMPELAGQLAEIDADWNCPQRNATVQRIWPEIRPQTIDYGIMEKAERVVVLPAADLGWNDVGSWESLFEVFPTDEHGNIVLDTSYIGLGTTGSLVMSEQTNRLVVTLGVSDLIVVDTPDALLICGREHSQKVREIVNLLKQNGEKRFL